MSEDLIDRFVAAVEAHYNVAGPPLLLSKFGQLNKELNAELKKAFGGLRAAIDEAGEDRLQLADRRPGREIVAPAAKAAAIEHQVREIAANQKEGSSNFDSLPVPVQLAFTVRADAGAVVAVKSTPPFSFSRLKSLEFMRPGYHHLPEEYRKPGLSLKAASLQDRDSLWRSFITWTQKSAIDPAAFKRGGPDNALARLLAAQSAEALPQLVIPADIAALLLRSK